MPPAAEMNFQKLEAMWKGLNADAPVFYPPTVPLPDMRDPEQAAAVEQASQAWATLACLYNYESSEQVPDLDLPPLPVQAVQTKPRSLSHGASSNGSNKEQVHSHSAGSTAASSNESTAEQVAMACLEEDCVCIMVRNLPNRCKLAALVAHFELLRVLDDCQTIHLPVDPRTGVNKGYAFVQVLQDAQPQFMATLTGTQLQGFLSRKRIDAGLADPTKGKRTVSKHTELWVRP